MIRDTLEVERFLGEGAFAEVYRVKHRFLGRQAIKVFKLVGTFDETVDLLSEAILLSRLGHPNIVRVFDANVVETSRGSCGFVTMEYVAGGSLEQFWQSHGGSFVPVDAAVDIIDQVCRGLSVAHNENPPIIHRDVKPQNILIGYDGHGVRARVADFGLAKRVNPLTRIATAKGTLCMKPPEVFRDYRSDSSAGDTWAIGCTLYLLLTDRLPFVDEKDVDTFDVSRFDNPLVPPSKINMLVDDVLDHVVMKALALDPADRYQTADQILRDLQQFKLPGKRKVATAARHSGAVDVSKNALGAHSPADQDQANRIVQRAISLAGDAGKLCEAADLLEEAFNKWPRLRDEQEGRLKNWRRGVTM